MIIWRSQLNKITNNNVYKDFSNDIKCKNLSVLIRIFKCFYKILQTGLI